MDVGLQKVSDYLNAKYGSPKEEPEEEPELEIHSEDTKFSFRYEVTYEGQKYSLQEYDLPSERGKLSEEDMVGLIENYKEVVEGYGWTAYCRFEDKRAYVAPIHED